MIGLLMLNFNLLFGENIGISVSPDLNNLTKRWSVEYQKLHPDMKIDITDNANINFISDKSEIIRHKSDWKMVIGRDIIVPIMNSKNPYKNDIYKKGMTLQNLNTITQNKTLTDVQNNINAIAFCKLTDIISNQKLLDNISFVPIDKNENGKIDFMENIYENPETFLRGVWIGKYPKSLSNSIYLVSSEKPNNQSEIAFINWVLTDGQKFLNSNGYSDLTYNEQQSDLNKLNETIVITQKDQYSTTNIILLCAIVFFVAVILITISFKYKKSDNAIVVGVQKFFNDQSLIIPKGLYFDKTHTWAFMEKDGSVKIGMDDFMQHVIGSITKIEMKNEGDKIIKNDPLFSVIQNGKKLNIYSPITGIIIEQNKKLNINSSLLNTDPYINGWIYTIQPRNWTLELQFLSVAEKYQNWIKNEFVRVKDFFTTIDNSKYSLILQDGGELKDNLLSNFDPKVWDDFQTEFIDTAIYTADKK